MPKKFIDEALIEAEPGSGGAGCVSFRREKYIPKGGPNGGDGGDGGSVYLKASKRVLNFSHILSKNIYKAKNGRPGQGRNKTGKSGQDLVIPVPLGTEVIDPFNSETLCDLIEEESFLLLKGGKGGKGNAFFKSSTNQTPYHAQPGEKISKKPFLLSLKLLADVGLVGLPNAGKSTLLTKLSKAKPKIAEYAFTTLSPNLGYLDSRVLKKILVADIPGIIEGASKGLGLGISFLKHIERVKLIIFVFDVSSYSILEEFNLLKDELKEYNPRLLDKPYMIVINKIDTINDHDFLQEYTSPITKQERSVFFVSCLNRSGIGELKRNMASTLLPDMKSRNVGRGSKYQGNKTFKTPQPING